MYLKQKASGAIGMVRVLKELPGVAGVIQDSGGQPLDIEDPTALRRYLAAGALVANGEPPTIVTLPGGVSGRTVLVEWPGGRSLVIKQSLPKLRVAVDWFCDPARVHREALGLRWAS